MTLIRITIRFSTGLLPQDQYDDNWWLLLLNRIQISNWALCEERYEYMLHQNPFECKTQEEKLIQPLV